MIKKTYRALSILIALSIAILIILFLSYVGKKSKGPLEDIVTKTGEAVQEVENKIIMDKREEKRANKLEWFKPYRTDSVLLRNPARILFGAFDNENRESFESSINLEDTLGSPFPLIHIYTAWGSKSDEQFPELQVKTILEMGSLPVITWEPWLTDFDSEKVPGLRPLASRDVDGMSDVAKGKYDSYIRAWAREAAKINEPIFVRLGHEMNDPYRYPWGPHNNSAKAFVAAWKHVYNLFKKEGAYKVLWVWSPHPAYGFFDAFYPGNKYVDYIGIGVLNYGTVANWSKWWTFGEIFGKHYNELAVYNKPIMITEFGSLTAGGKRDQWFEEALHQLPQKYPLIKSILFFHFSEDKTTTQQVINWYFINDARSVKAIKTEIGAWEKSE
ncbi:MAG TPA: glycosyl hydrolase [Bacteroidia bacterium]|nr:glycosyl hydrolase [Bacteroidia bacterium]